MLEAINTAATVATLVVLSVGAIAAAIQLRHMRTGNQLQAFLDIYNRVQTPQVEKQFQFVLHDLPKLTEDPQYLQPFFAGTVSFHDSPLILAFWFDEVGAALRQGLITDNIIFQMGSSAYVTVRCWRNMRPIIDAVRTRGPASFIHFEYSAVRAQQWLDAHPKGDYPAGVPRWADLESLKDAMLSKQLRVEGQDAEI
jgi:hypothetical protein